eukprot:653551-Amphidinium_carterae.2
MAFPRATTCCTQSSLHSKCFVLLLWPCLSKIPFFALESVHTSSFTSKPSAAKVDCAPSPSFIPRTAL